MGPENYVLHEGCITWGYTMVNTITRSVLGGNALVILMLKVYFLAVVK